MSDCPPACEVVGGDAVWCPPEPCVLNVDGSLVADCPPACEVVGGDAVWCPPEPPVPCTDYVAVHGDVFGACPAPCDVFADQVICPPPCVLVGDDIECPPPCELVAGDVVCAPCDDVGALEACLPPPPCVAHYVDGEEWCAPCQLDSLDRCLPKCELDPATYGPCVPPCDETTVADANAVTCPEPCGVLIDFTNGEPVETNVFDCADPCLFDAAACSPCSVETLDSYGYCPEPCLISGAEPEWCPERCDPDNPDSSVACVEPCHTLPLDAKTTECVPECTYATEIVSRDCPIPLLADGSFEHGEQGTDEAAAETANNRAASSAQSLTYDPILPWTDEDAGPANAAIDPSTRTIGAPVPAAAAAGDSAQVPGLAYTGSESKLLGYLGAGLVGFGALALAARRKAV